MQNTLHHTGIWIRRWWLGRLDCAVLSLVIDRDVYELRNLSSWQPGAIIDVGAHIGCFAIHAHRTWPNVPITCVEPAAGNVSCLEMNAGQFAKIIPHPLTNIADPVLVSCLTPDTHTTECCNILPRELAREKKGTVIEDVITQTVTLADCIGTHKNVLLKLDCEGCEEEALRQPLDNVKYIIAEFHNGKKWPEYRTELHGQGWTTREKEEGSGVIFWAERNNNE